MKVGTSAGVMAVAAAGLGDGAEAFVAPNPGLPSGTTRWSQRAQSRLQMGVLGRPGAQGVVIEGGSGRAVAASSRTRQRRPDLRKLDHLDVQASSAALYDDYEVDEAKEDREIRQDNEAYQEEEKTLDELYHPTGKKYKAYRIGPITVRPTYGYFTWHIIGLSITGRLFAKWVRKGFSFRKVSMPTVMWQYVVSEPEHLAELHAYKCQDCGWTIFPARGRHQVFFDDKPDFACVECGAGKERFYDINDPTDPRNQKKKKKKGASAAKGSSGGEKAGEGEGADGEAVEDIEEQSAQQVFAHMKTREKEMKQQEELERLRKLRGDVDEDDEGEAEDELTD